MSNTLERYPSIKGTKCPSCRLSTLFLAEGNYITCGNLDCNNPDYEKAIKALITEAENKAVQEFCSRVL